MDKSIIKLIAIGLFLTNITGCVNSDETGASLENETVGTIGQDQLVTMGKEETVNIQTMHEIDFKNTNLVFNPIYKLSKKRADNWIFTQSSSIDLGLRLEETNDDIEIMVAQVYADISLLSRYYKYNGIRQDSLNIEYFSLPNGGVTIDKTENFSIPFQIEGIDKNETFFRLYNGYGSSVTKRVTENDLQENVQGAVLNVVWTIIVKDSTGSMYIKTINDRIGIPYNWNINDE